MNKDIFYYYYVSFLIWLLRELYEYFNKNGAVHKNKNLASFHFDPNTH